MAVVVVVYFMCLRLVIVSFYHLLLNVACAIVGINDGCFMATC